MRQLTLKKPVGGFTYLTLMLVIAVMATVLGATAEVWHTAVRREKERELLFVGNEFRKAIKSYFRDHARYPASLEDLLKDPLSPIPRRYLRKIYRDPMTGDSKWGLVQNADGGIMGVHSLSDAPPIKIARFGTDDSGFDGAVKYSAWMFVYTTPRYSRILNANQNAGSGNGTTGR